MYRFFRPALFKLDPETAHQLTLQLMRLAGYQPFHAISCARSMPRPKNRSKLSGCSSKIRSGWLPATTRTGLPSADSRRWVSATSKSGRSLRARSRGIPKPRIFRLVEDEAVINRMGFPGKGAEFVARVIVAPSNEQAARNDIIIGVNLGKNKDTPLEEAARITSR